MRIAQIINNRVHLIFEKDTDVLPVFPPYLNGETPLLIDITSKPEVEEGWKFDLESQEFSVFVEEDIKTLTENNEEDAVIDKLEAIEEKLEAILYLIK